MGTKSNNLGGRFFYQAKGLQGLLFKVPEDTKISLRVLAHKLDKPVYETVQLILSHFLDKPDLYDVNGSSSQNGPMVDMQAFVDPQVHKRMKEKRIYARRSLKDLTGVVIHQYLTKHCKVNLGDEDGNKRSWSWRPKP